MLAVRALDILFVAEKIKRVSSRAIVLIPFLKKLIDFGEISSTS
jgi:hypothetical protein